MNPPANLPDNLPHAFQEPETGPLRKWGPMAAGVLVLLGAGWFLYSALTDIQGVAVKDAPPTVVDMLPPPPPPPPPPEPQQQEPEPTEKQDAPPEPTPEQPAPAPMQIDGPAQAGGDAYGLQAGKGGGMGAPAGPPSACTGPNCGTGVAGTDRFWGRTVSNALEDHIERSKAVNVDAFVSEYEIWVNADGALTQARLVRSSGNARLDQTVLGLLEKARGLRPPPPSVRMPQRVRVGRKRF